MLDDAALVAPHHSAVSGGSSAKLAVTRAPGAWYASVRFVTGASVTGKGEDPTQWPADNRCRYSAIHSVLTLAQASNAIRISEHFRVVTPNVRRAVGGTVNQRHLKRNRKFVDSPQEGDGFELLVPWHEKPRIFRAES
jgi:hypothetical protein